MKIRCDAQLQLDKRQAYELCMNGWLHSYQNISSIRLSSLRTTYSWTDSLLERGMIPSNRLPARPVQSLSRTTNEPYGHLAARCGAFRCRKNPIYANAPLVRYGSAAFTRYMFSNCKEIVTNDPKIPSLKFCASAITSQPDPKQCMLEAKQYHSIHRQQQVKRSMNPEGLTSKVHGFPLENKDAQDATQI